MQSAIFFVPTRFYALFRADSRKIITFYNHFSADFFVIFCGNVFSRQQNFLSLIRVLYFLMCDIIKALDDFAEIMDNFSDTL